MALRGRSVLSCQKVLRKVPPRGSTGVPPRFHQGCPSFVVSPVFWGRCVLSCQKVPWKVPPRVPQCKAPPKFHQGCPSFIFFLAFWGRCVLSPMLLGIFFGLMSKLFFQVQLRPALSYVTHYITIHPFQAQVLSE